MAAAPGCRKGLMPGKQVVQKNLKPEIQVPERTQPANEAKVAATSVICFPTSRGGTGRAAHRGAKIESRSNVAGIRIA
jgi:hypothetical protein